MKLINKTGIKNNHKGLLSALVECINNSLDFYGSEKDFYKTEYNYNFTNNGNSWSRTTVYFRKSKKSWIAE